MAHDDTKDDGSQLSEDTIACLEDAKKGKPRRFVMICKGTQLVSLVAFKKGSYEKFKKEAKQSGKGQFYFGVINGKGPNLLFQLAIADGFESAPTKTQVLRNFLDEKAGLKTKSEYEIVPQLGPLWDEAHPLVARFIKLQPSITKIIGLKPAVTEELTSACDSIREQLEGDEPDAATDPIAKLEARLRAIALELKDINPAGAAPQSVESAAPPMPPPSDQAAPASASAAQPQGAANSTSNDASGDAQAEFTKRLKALKPRIDMTLERPGPTVELLKQLLARLGPLAKARQFAEASAVLDEIEQNLGNTNAPTTPPVQKVDPGVLFTSRLKQLKPDLDRALAMSTPGAEQLRKRVGEMSEMARSKDFVQANTQLLSVTELVQRLLATSSQGGSGNQASNQEPTDRVRYMQARIFYQNSINQAQSDLNRLVESVRTEFSNAPEFEAISSAVAALSNALSGFDSRLVDTLDLAYTAKNVADIPALHQDAVTLIGEYQGFLDEHTDLFKKLDANPFTPVQIDSRLRETLSNLADQLA